MTAEQARERASEIVTAHTPASFRATTRAVTLRDEIAEALLAGPGELRVLLRDCAARLHAAAASGGNSRAAVEELVRPFLDAAGAPMPPWPSWAPEHGRG